MGVDYWNRFLSNRNRNVGALIGRVAVASSLNRSDGASGQVISFQLQRNKSTVCRQITTDRENVDINLYFFKNET